MFWIVLQNSFNVGYRLLLHTWISSRQGQMYLHSKHIAELQHLSTYLVNEVVLICAHISFMNEILTRLDHHTLETEMLRHLLTPLSTEQRSSFLACTASSSGTSRRLKRQLTHCMHQQQPSYQLQMLMMTPLQRTLTAVLLMPSGMALPRFLI